MINMNQDHQYPHIAPPLLYIYIRRRAKNIKCNFIIGEISLNTPHNQAKFHRFHTKLLKISCLGKNNYFLQPGMIRLFLMDNLITLDRFIFGRIMITHCVLSLSSFNTAQYCSNQ